MRSRGTLDGPERGPAASFGIGRPHRRLNGRGSRGHRMDVVGANPDVMSSARSADVELDLSVDLGRGLVLSNPVLAASGVFGYGVEYADVIDVNRLGAICT